MKTDIKLNAIPTGGYFFLCCLCGAFAFAIYSISSCEARSQEARNQAIVEAQKESIEFTKWQLENGYLSKEEFERQQKSPLDKFIENFGNTELTVKTNKGESK